MIFTDNYSFFFILVFIAFYNASKGWFDAKHLKNGLLILGSVVVLTTLTNIVSLGIIIGISTGVYFGGLYLKRLEKPKFLLGLFVTLLISFFVLKNYKIANFDLLQRVGLSYILFRLIHFLVESSNRKIVKYDIGSFVNYIIFFPTFIAGPIDSYNNFDYWISSKRRNYDISLFKTGLFKLFVGVVKKFVLVPVIAVYASDFALFDVNHIWQVGLIYSMLLYSAYILLDFSGYSDIAIGTAYLIGIKTPENFDNPYGANNLSTFWKKWHMTFSNFLFKYVFKPVVVNFAFWFPNAKRLTVSFIGYLITFTICGIWHGPTLNFIYWGLWHGIFLYLYKIWDVNVIGNRIKGQSVIVRRYFNYLGVLITFIVVTVGWLFFNYQTVDLGIISRNFVSSQSESLIVTTVLNKKIPVLKIELPTSASSNIDSLEIELIGGRSGHIQMFKGIQPNTSNTYYLIPENSGKTLYEVNLTTFIENGEPFKWSQVAYMFKNKFKPTAFQTFLFGENVGSKKITINDSEILISEMYLDKKYEKGISLESKHFDNYGWAIQVNHIPHEKYLVWIEFRKKGDKQWVVVQKDRDANYGFYHIHGNYSFDETSRNIAPGTYEVRFKYVTDLNDSKWYYSSLEMQDYVNN